MDENQCDEKMRRSFRLAAPDVDADSFCRTALAREADGPEKLGHRRSARQRRLNLGWAIVLAAVGGVVLGAAIVAAVTSTRATAEESPLATIDWHSDTPLELRYLPGGSIWSETYRTILSPAMSSADLSAAIKRGEKPGVRVEQCLYQNGPDFIQVGTVTDTGGPMPSGNAVEVNGRPGVLQTGMSGLLKVTSPEPDLAVEFLGAQPDASNQMTTTTAGPSGSASTGSDSWTSVTVPPANKEPIPYRDAIRLTWIVDGTRVVMLSNLSAEELIKVAQGLVLGTTQ